MSRYAALAAQLAHIEEAGLRRTLRPLTMTGPTRARFDGRDVTVFSSNDYLGLAQHPDVVSAYKGGGVGASRLISGDRQAHHGLEEQLR